MFVLLHLHHRFHPQILHFQTEHGGNTERNGKKKSEGMGGGGGGGGGNVSRDFSLGSFDLTNSPY